MSKYLGFICFSNENQDLSILRAVHRASQVVPAVENLSANADVRDVDSIVCIIKAMIFPVVTYGCWTISVEELMLSNCGAREDS